MEITAYLYPDAAATGSFTQSYEALISASIFALLPDEPVIGYQSVASPCSPVYELLDAAPGMRHQAITTLEAQHPHAPHALNVGAGIRMAVLCGQPFSASTVLNPAEMLRLQQHLGGKSLWVTVPNQATLYAMPSDGSPASYETLLRMTSSVFRDEKKNFPTSLPVSYTVWLVTDGRVVGAAPRPAEEASRPWWKKIF